ncbi:hypothetical protein Droror1_Dr00011699 [Drosera rotundifolia]
MGSFLNRTHGPGTMLIGIRGTPWDRSALYSFFLTMIPQLLAKSPFPCVFRDLLRQPSSQNQAAHGDEQENGLDGDKEFGEVAGKEDDQEDEPEHLGKVSMTYT